MYKQFGQCVRDIRTLSKLSDFSLKLNCNLVNDLEARETLLHPCPLSSAFAEKFNSHFRLWYSNGWFLVCHPPAHFLTNVFLWEDFVLVCDLTGDVIFHYTAYYFRQGVCEIRDCLKSKRSAMFG